MDDLLIGHRLICGQNVYDCRSQSTKDGYRRSDLAVGGAVELQCAGSQGLQTIVMRGEPGRNGGAVLRQESHPDVIP